MVRSLAVLLRRDNVHQQATAQFPLGHLTCVMMPSAIREYRRGAALLVSCSRRSREHTHALCVRAARMTGCDVHSYQLAWRT